MAIRRTVRIKTREQRELEPYRDHDPLPYVRERCGAILKIAAGATPMPWRGGLLQSRGLCCNFSLDEDFAMLLS